MMLFLPLICLIVLVSAALSFLEFQAALFQTVNRHLSYKAEQLRDFLYSEWSVVRDLKLAKQEDYRRATEASFRSYAYSLLRDESEQVIVLDQQKNLVWAVGLGTGAATPAPGSEAGAVPDSGWFSTRVAKDDLVGVSFSFKPFRWTVAMAQLREVFFSGIQNILFLNLWILLGAILIGAVLTTVHVASIVRPVERLSRALALIADTGDLSLRVEVDVADEIGMLTHRFNVMIEALERNQKDLFLSAQAERAAKETASQREAETLLLLGKISDFRDEETGQHLNRIGAMSELFARLLGHSEHAQTLIRNSSPLHDLGKIAIPDAILSKPGPLTAEEITSMHLHTAYGYEILKSAQSQFLVEGAAIAMAHHEKWDGTGYPNGLSGEEIPLSARIVAIVDVFDALVSKRPYKRAWSFAEALEFMVTQSGGQFDPDLMVVFERNFSLFVEVQQSMNGNPTGP